MATTAIADVAIAAQANFKGYNEITMTNWTSATLKPLIAIGSTFELGGTIYQTATADQDTDPAAAWAGLAINTLVYLYATAAAGTITFSVSVTAPTWDTAKQGYYNGAARCLGQFYKDSGGNWTKKTIYRSREYGEMYGGFNIGIGADADRMIVYGTTWRYLLWEESKSRLSPGARFYHRSGHLDLTGGVTEDQVYTAISGAVADNSDHIVLVGRGVVPGPATYDFVEAVKLAGLVRIGYVTAEGAYGTLNCNSGGAGTAFNSGYMAWGY